MLRRLFSAQLPSSPAAGCLNGELCRLFGVDGETWFCFSGDFLVLFFLMVFFNRVSSVFPKFFLCVVLIIFYFGPHCLIPFGDYVWPFFLGFLSKSNERFSFFLRVFFDGGFIDGVLIEGVLYGF